MGLKSRRLKPPPPGVPAQPVSIPFSVGDCGPQFFFAVFFLLLSSIFRNTPQFSVFFFCNFPQFPQLSAIFAISTIFRNSPQFPRSFPQFFWGDSRTAISLPVLFFSAQQGAYTTHWFQHPKEIWPGKNKLFIWESNENTASHFSDVNQGRGAPVGWVRFHCGYDREAGQDWGWQWGPFSRGFWAWWDL